MNGGEEEEANKHCQLTIFPVTSYLWQGRHNNRCMVRGVRGALWILRGALSVVCWGVEEEEANKHCQIDYTSGDIYSELHEQLQMPMPTFLELSPMMIDFTKSCNYYYCCDYNEWGGGGRRRPAIGGSPKKMSIFLNGPKIISLCLILQYLVWIWYSESLV
jgi:hypothetical protein